MSFTFHSKDLLYINNYYYYSLLLLYNFIEEENRTVESIYKSMT